MPTGRSPTHEEGALRAKGNTITPALRKLGDATNRPFTMQTKEGRIRLQKAVYLLKATGYAQAQKFDFSIYLNGPYSPELTEVYYLLDDEGLNAVNPAADVPAETLTLFSEADSKGNLFLEALTTAIDGARSQGQAGVGLDWASAIKPHIPDETWKGVRLFLRAHPQLIGST